MKKQILIIALVLTAIIVTQNVNAGVVSTDSIKMNEVNAKAVKNFQKEFSSVNDARWYACENGGYTVSFTANSVHTVAGFDPKGRLLGSIKYYNEKDLPATVWEQVKSSYYAYNILKVAEISSYNRKTYMLYLENDKFTKIISVTNDDMQEMQSFKKG